MALVDGPGFATKPWGFQTDLLRSHSSTNVRTNLVFLRGARTPIDLANEEEARFTKMMAALVDAVGQPVLSPCARNHITVSCRSPASSRRVDHVVTPHRENEWNMSRRDVVRARHHRANIGC